jgi:beta propeller domain-containing protein
MRPSLIRTVLITVTAFGLLAAACSADDSLGDALPPGGGDKIVIDLNGDEIQLTSALSGFESCENLLDYLQTEGAERVGPWGFNDGWYGGPWPVDAIAVEEAAFSGDDSSGFDTAAPVATAQGGSDGLGQSFTEGVDFSGTNVQEIGVDEADIVKTDGERVFIVANGQLVIVDVASRSVVGSVAVPSGDRAELFIDGDDVLLVNQSYGYNGDVVFEDGVSIEEDIAIAPGGFGGGSTTTITRIAIVGNSPRIIETLSAEGDYVSARAVDGVARIIVRSNPQYNFPFVYPQGESGQDRAEESNREALLDSTLADWLPGYTLVDANGSTTREGLLVPCERVNAPTEFAGFGVLSVLTVDVDGDIDPGTTAAVLAPGEVVYASPDSVYVATTTWFDRTLFDGDLSDDSRAQIEQNITTSIHRFDITSDSGAAYTASGSVEGTIRDSFSFSEYNGDLRVVTTTGNNWDETSESFLRVLRETDGELVEIGSVGDMGNGEAVQSVRFQGDVGYVVTFRQVDPLYTVDLSDPENPRVRGELKIPGFSSYLHPIGDGFVIGVGSDADEQSGRTTGSKVSLFDVNDLDNPREVATWIGPDSWNSVGWDTRAFLWWAPENLAVVPIQTWADGQQWAGAVVLRIEDSTITEVGRIDHSDETATPGQTACSVISDDDLPTSNSDEFESELEYMISDGYGLVLDCEPGEARTASGYDCFSEDWLTGEAARIGVETDGTLVMCYPIGDGMPQISRSIVLPGGELWTVSSAWGWLGGQNPARLQVNDLTTLERLGAVNL